MTATPEVVCPGCGLEMPADERAVYDGYYNCSPQCWGVYSELLGFEFSNAVVFGAVHQMTVDTYALQHAGGPHPDKSVAVHLAGLHAAFILGIHQTKIPQLLQALAKEVETWPHFPRPDLTSDITVFDIALAETPMAHIDLVQEWAGSTWECWSDYHAEIAELVSTRMPQRMKVFNE